MLVVHNDAMCYTCKNNPRITQTDGTESTEKWVCDAYKKGIPTNIIVGSGKCNRYINV